MPSGSSVVKEPPSTSFELVLALIPLSLIRHTIALPEVISIAFKLARVCEDIVTTIIWHDKSEA
jgi:hypothetical protein